MKQEELLIQEILMATKVKHAAMNRQKMLQYLQQLSDPEIQNEVVKSLKKGTKLAAVNPLVKNILMAITLLAPNLMASSPSQVADLVAKRGPDVQQALIQAEREVSNAPLLKLLHKERYQQIKKEVAQNKHDVSKLVEIITKYQNELGDAGLTKAERKSQIQKLLTEAKVSESIQKEVAIK